MKKITLILITLIVSVAIQFIEVLPWWSFAAALVLLGVLLPFKKWKMSPVIAGIISGFLTWAGGLLFFTWYYEGNIIGKVAEALGFSQFMILLIAGVICALISALALLVGAKLREGKDNSELIID
ncbi:MAG: hypothetical protein GQ574_00240 [Crocinitomix sp.]|nr:hypothetical protein [Crocinitomix sp.]